MTARPIHRPLALLLLAAVALHLALTPLLAETASRFELTAPERPFLVTDGAFSLYVGTPLALTATLLVLFSPGLVIAAALFRPAHLWDLVLKALAVSLAFHAVTSGCLVAAYGGAVPREVLAAALVVPAALAAVAAWFLPASRAFSEELTQDLRARSWWLLAFLLLVTYTLLPLAFWQELNGDGHEILTMGRSLSEHAVPRLPGGQVAGLAIGMMTPAYPVAWFIAFIGDQDAAARLPALPHLVALFAAVLALVEHGAARRLTTREGALVALGVAAVGATQGYCATYHPYFADLSSPGVIDFLAAVWLLGICHFLWTRDFKWFLVFVVASVLTRPTTSMWLVMIAAGTALCDRTELRRTLRWVAAGLCVTVALIFGYEFVALDLFGVPLEQPSEEAAGRIRFLLFTDWWRLLLVVVPCGVVPVFALFRFRDLDARSRTLAVVLAGYTAFFHVMAFFVLHHYLPAMLLPIVLWWRWCASRPPNAARDAVVAAGAVAALWIAIPPRFEIERTVRNIGSRTWFAIGEYDGPYDRWRASFEARRALDGVFRTYHHVAEPGKELLGGAWLQIRYARANRGVTPDIDYVVLPPSAPAPDGFLRVCVRDDAVAYVRSREIWDRDRFSPPRDDCGGSVYSLSKEVTTRRWGQAAGRYSIDLTTIFGTRPTK